MLETKDGRVLNVEELAWDEVCDSLAHLLPDFTRIIAMLPKKAIAGCKFYKARYAFGDKIISDGKCYLPLDNGNSIEFGDPRLSNELIEALAYDPATEDPLGLILSKNSEFYLIKNKKILPHTLISPGYMFGIPRAVENLQDVPLSRSALGYNLNAGARSLFLVSKITDKDKHLRLQKHYHTKLPVPIGYEEQWLVFKDIARRAECTWNSEVLYFSRKFIAALKNAELALLANYLLQKHRAYYNVWHNVSLLWVAAFNDAEQKKRLTHYSSYSLSTARQLFIIAANSAPGFRPATDNNTAPISLLEEAYASGYGLSDDDHSNVIMEPCNFAAASNDGVYYSLNYPTLASYSPSTFKGKSYVSLLDEVKSITSAYQEAILKEPVNSRVQSLYDAAKATQFTYYHYMPQDYKNILDDSVIAEQDMRFVQNKCGKFPRQSSFFRGCIKIATKI